MLSSLSSESFIAIFAIIAINWAAAPNNINITIAVCILFLSLAVRAGIEPTTLLHATRFQRDYHH